ncbi:outer membrane protein assembly factor [Dickeya dadantii]|uniref:autotransporter assembly complex protein TamA n=1 Tax=Dickeya dadantii TaxID=204038 RepID=UPI00149587BA|nr:autotransporter assembly complex family protein [Dickeya dadantii]NPE59936.1 outer membrane protein assembly factor [Dickeya dadantii]NPE70205.1 outer membrane protein assembly factor [Dickeya dadantii]
MLCRTLGLGSLLLMAAPALAASNVRLQLTGLEGELQKNVRARLSTITPDEVNADGRFRAWVDEAIRKGLRALGYYDPEIRFEFIPSQGRGRPVLKVTVKPGEPVKIAGSSIAIRGGAQSDEDYQKLVRQHRPVEGSILNHGAYDDFKSQLSTLSMRKGYFDGRFNKSQLGVMPSTHQAWWDIDYDSGTRYRFGKVNFRGSQIQSAYLRNLVPFQEGDVYSAEQLGEFNRRLSATGWFNSVVVAPDFEQGRRGKVLPLDAVLTPRTRNSVETGVGYATDVGPRLKTTWKRPWVNAYGHSLESSLSLSAPEQQLDLSYKIPLLKSPLEQYYLVQGGFKREDLNDTQSDSTSLNLARYWELSSGWQRAVNLHWTLDHFTQANVTNTTMLIYPGLSFNRTRQRGGLMPDWGDTQRYSVDVSNTLWGSDIDFAVFQAQNVWIRSLAEKHRFVARANLGWIETGSFSRVPPSLRFFAGGDRSIRGYKYKSVSPRDSDGKLTGASKLATGSLEYQYNVTGKWWGAVFVDSGEAVNDLARTNLKTGAGIGIRWASPVGPIKLDIARPIGDNDKHGLQFYIGLGPEL